MYDLYSTQDGATMVYTIASPLFQQASGAPRSAEPAAPSSSLQTGGFEAAGKQDEVRPGDRACVRACIGVHAASRPCCHAMPQAQQTHQVSTPQQTLLGRRAASLPTASCHLSPGAHATGCAE